MSRGKGGGWWLLLALLAAPAQAATVRYVHTDALGSVVAKTDENGTVVERTEYEPYGKVLNRPVHDGPGYTGHVEDAATGLVYAQQRYLDRELGRFLSVDPVTADANTGANFNRYKYAGNNPYRFTDPDGRCERPTGSHTCGGGAGSNVSVTQINASSGRANTNGSSAEAGANTYTAAPARREQTSAGQFNDSSQKSNGIKPLVSCNQTNTCVPQDRLDEIDLGGAKLLGIVYGGGALGATVIASPRTAVMVAKTPKGREVLFWLLQEAGFMQGQRPSLQLQRQRTEIQKAMEGVENEAAQRIIISP